MNHESFKYRLYEKIGINSAASFNFRIEWYSTGHKNNRIHQRGCLANRCRKYAHANSKCKI